jgi:hypothetical protein
VPIIVDDFFVHRPWLWRDVFMYFFHRTIFLNGERQEVTMVRRIKPVARTAAQGSIATHAETHGALLPVRGQGARSRAGRIS